MPERPTAAWPGAGAATRATAAWRGDGDQLAAAQAAGAAADPPPLAGPSWTRGGGAPSERRSSTGPPATAARLPTTASGGPGRDGGQDSGSAPSDDDRVRVRDVWAGAQATKEPSRTATEKRSKCGGGAWGAPGILARGAGAAVPRQSPGAGEWGHCDTRRAGEGTAEGRDGAAGAGLAQPGAVGGRAGATEAPGFHASRTTGPGLRAGQAHRGDGSGLAQPGAAGGSSCDGLPDADASTAASAGSQTILDSDGSGDSARDVGAAPGAQARVILPEGAGCLHQAAGQGTATLAAEVVGPAAGTPGEGAAGATQLPAAAAAQRPLLARGISRSSSRASKASRASFRR